MNGDEVKACCARTYQADVVALILGESYHPGGLELTRRLARSMNLRRGERVLDVASGPGTTAFLLAEEFGVQVEGVDLGDQAVAKANAKAAEARHRGPGAIHGGRRRAAAAGGRVRRRGDVRVRLLHVPRQGDGGGRDRPCPAAGGRVGITDVALDQARLDDELKTLGAWVACLADARPLDEYVEILGAAGLHTTLTEHHDEGLARMIQQIDARLVAFKMVKVPALEAIDFDQARHRVALAGQAVREGIAGYKLLVAEKPA